MTLITQYIDGQHTTGTGTERGQVFDPATGQVSAEVAFADEATVDAAVAVATRAFASWRQVSLGRRTAILFKLRELMSSHTDELARILLAEHGKVLDDARGEVGRALDVVEFACGIPQLLKGDFSDQVSTDLDVYSFREPLGVVGCITPFNFPVMVPSWMVPIAVATGNTVVLKASERDPSATLRLAELWSEAGLPDGVFNVVQGGPVVVNRLLSHPDIAAVSFVGSTPVARHVYETATANGKRVQALGGAKNHAVILPDADLDFAASNLAAAAFGAAGERCMAIATAVVVEPIADRLIELVAHKADEVTVAPGLTPGAEMGPVITAAARDRIEGYLDSAAAAGATIVRDGRGLVVPGHEGGFFTGPSIIDHVTPKMDCYRDEIFGPVLTVVRVGDIDEAIELIRANPYGNGAAIFTASGGAARRFVRGVNIGMIGVNVPIPVPVAYHSFGGWKASLFGESHIYGPEGVRFYTRAKAVSVRWPSADPVAAEFNFAGASQALQ